MKPFVNCQDFLPGDKQEGDGEGREKGEKGARQQISSLYFVLTPNQGAWLALTPLTPPPLKKKEKSIFANV